MLKMTVRMKVVASRSEIRSLHLSKREENVSNAATTRQLLPYMTIHDMTRTTGVLQRVTV